MEMGATPDEKVRETSDRLILLLITRPLEGWEVEFEEITRREIARLAIPAPGIAEALEDGSGAAS